MLTSNRRGYAIMDRELSGYYIESESLETCMQYCNKDKVVVEMIPYVNGFMLRFCKWPFQFGRHFIEYDKYASSVYIWKFQIQWRKEYNHRPGKIVYDPLKQ